MKSKEYIEKRIKDLTETKKELLKEYQKKIDSGIEDEGLWQYICTKNVELWTLKDILND